jgi:hypothetical protein
MAKMQGIYAHYKKEGKTPITITHKWKGGEHVEKIDAKTDEKKYTVSGGPLKDNLSISIKAE